MNNLPRTTQSSLRNRVLYKDEKDGVLAGGKLEEFLCDGCVLM